MLRQFFLGLVLMLGSGALHAQIVVPEIPQIPAFLPKVDSVPASGKSRIDGVYRISSIGKRIRIERGRAYALDPWLHLFVLKIEPRMVVVKNIRRQSGQYVGEDLPLLGAWTATPNNGNLDVTVAGAFGPVKYQLIREGGGRGYPEEDDYYEEEEDYSDDDYYEDEYSDDEYSEDEYSDDEYSDDDYYEDPVADRPVVKPPFDWPGRPRPPRANPNDPTPHCGGLGQKPCPLTKASFAGKAKNLGCPGKQNYFSTIRGGSCWSCPSGYKRTHRKMDHAKACVKRKSLTGPWKTASFKGGAWGCPAGQFHMGSPVGGKCMSCPKGYKRIHAAGADTGMCKPVKKCDAPLRTAKQPPKDKVLDSIAGTSRNKVCAPKFDLKVAADRDLPRFKQFKGPGIKLVEDLLDKRVRKRFKKAIKNKDHRAAFAMLKRLNSYGRLADQARSAGFDSLSVGVGSDVQLGVGGNGEVGFAIDLKRERIVGYESLGYSKGFSIGIDSGVTIGLWKGGFETGYTQGFTASVGGVVSAGAGVWYTYFDPAKKSQERIAGITFAGGVGLGIEFGEYNEVGTRVY